MEEENKYNGLLVIDSNELNQWQLEYGSRCRGFSGCLKWLFLFFAFSGLCLLSLAAFAKPKTHWALGRLDVG